MPKGVLATLCVAMVPAPLTVCEPVPVTAADSAFDVDERTEACIMHTQTDDYRMTSRDLRERVRGLGSATDEVEWVMFEWGQNP